MRRPLLLALAATLALSGCARLAESRLNPLNWFGRSEAEAGVTVGGPVDPLVPASRRVVEVDARVLIDSVTELTIAPTPSGAILRATGEAATQGFFNAELVLVAAENGVLTYQFRVERPAGFEVAGSAASRRIAVATELSTQDLAGVRRIVVQGARSSRSVSR